MISSINSNQSFGSLCAICIDTSKDIEAVVPYVKAACNQMGKKFNGIRRTGYVEDACRIW